MKLVVRNASGQTSPSAWRHLRISGVFLRALPLHPQTESRPWRRRSSQWGHDLGHVTASQGDSAVERRWAPLRPWAQLSNRHKLVGNRWNGSILEMESCSSLLRLLLVDGCILYHSFAFQKSWRFMFQVSASRRTQVAPVLFWPLKGLSKAKLQGAICLWKLAHRSPPIIQSQLHWIATVPLQETTAIWCEAILDATWCCIRCK